MRFVIGAVIGILLIVVYAVLWRHAGRPRPGRKDHSEWGRRADSGEPEDQEP